MQNCIEDKFLKQKLDSFSREKLYIDKELRRISLAKSSLLESLDRFNTVPRSTHKRLSLPCLLDGPRKEHSVRPISSLRRHTIPPVDTAAHAVAECKQPLKSLEVPDASLQSRKEASSTQSAGGEGTHSVQIPRSALRVGGLQRQQQTHDIRFTSPVTASLILSGQVDTNRSKNERPLFSRLDNTGDAKTVTPLHLPKLNDIPAKRADLNPVIPKKIPAGQENPRDSMLATNLKSKFRQIGSVVMATAILRIAHDKKKKETAK